MPRRRSARTSATCGSRPSAAATTTARASSSRRCGALTAASACRTDTDGQVGRPDPPLPDLMSAILVTRKLPSSVLAKLSAVASVDLYTGDAAIPADELRARMADKDALVCLLTDGVDRTVIDAAPTLKVIANVAVGYNNIDVAHARSRGIVVTNTPDVLTESVADFTWALILAITRRLSEGERLVRRGEWKGWALDLLLGTE